MPEAVWTVAMCERLRALCGRRPRPPHRGDAAAVVLSEYFPDRQAAEAALRALERQTKRRRWTPAEESELRRRYPVEAARAIARDLRRGVSAVYQRAWLLGVEKDPDVLAEQLRDLGRRAAATEAARANQFKPGQEPPNKGKKGWDSGGRSHETRFKPGERSGQAAINWMPIGSVRWIPGPGPEDGKGGSYLYRKVSDVPNVPYTINWRPLHHLRWERFRGQVPPGKVLVFRSGDRTDVRIPNLELISRAELARRNVMWNKYPRELALAIQLRGALRRQIRRRDRKEEGDGQDNTGRSQGTPVCDARGAS